MQLYSFVALQLLVSTALAKPIARHRLDRHRLQPRQVTNTSIPVQTQTSIDPAFPTLAASTDCIVTPTISADDRCGSVANTYNIRLSTIEANSLADSETCRYLLLGYRICIEFTSPSTDSAHLTNSTLTSNPTTPALIKRARVFAKFTPTSGSTVLEATAVPSAITRLQTTTVTHTLGFGRARTLRTFVATHATTELLTFVTTVAPTLSRYSQHTDGSSSSSSIPATSSIASSSLFVSTLSSSSETTAITSTVTSTITSSSSSSTLSSTDSAAATSTSATATSSACAQTVSAPAPTQSGIVSGCTEWYTAVAGDICSSVAADYGISVDTFMAWNPAVDPPICPNMLAGDAYCVATCDGGEASPTTTAAATATSATASATSATASATSATASATSATASATSANASATSATASATATAVGSDVYRTYTGDGSLADGWPAQSDWVDFDAMFDANTANMKASCAQWGVPLNTDDEVSEMKAAITATASSSDVDARFILATIMQESTGCVRVITTQYSHYNPGLMQSHNGTGSCNTNNAFLTSTSTGLVQTPCPASEISQMIEDGTTGTSSGDGLEQLLVQQGHTDVSRWYRAARMYNGGSIDPSGDLGKGCCTLCYVSDIANRMTGWVNAPSTCSL